MNLTPKEIVRQLDRYIIGQDAAKRSVAIALRNRYRRSQLDDKLKEEITPKNIIMIGPTGVGKTEIARRLAKLVHAPFIKVEATKFTEVGYVGRDVESIIRDLVEASIRMVKNEKMAGVREQAERAAEERILDALLPPRRKKAINPFNLSRAILPMRKKMRRPLRSGLRRNQPAVPGKSCARGFAAVSWRTLRLRLKWTKAGIPA